jgi:REP element-mobilizing transposase RayT
MARPLRLELAGGLYHITARGDRREAIYFSESDRKVWLDLLREVCSIHNWRCHAWCQMTNHYHLVIETPDGNLTRGMRQLNGRYAQYVNRTQRRVGHLFQGRYTAILVEKDSYLIELARYVVLNPVRAGMVNDATEWPWSSYAATVGQAEAPDWLEADWILGQFGENRRAAVSNYIDFVRAGVGLASIWEDLAGQVFLGSEAFVERMRSRLPKDDLREVPRVQRRAPPRPLSDYLAFPDRKTGMAEAYLTGAYTMKEIADAFAEFRGQ